MRSKVLLPFLLISILWAGNPPITRWIDPLGGKPITPQEYESQIDFPDTPLVLGRVSEWHNTDFQLTPMVDIIVNAAIYPYIAGEIDRFAEDIAADGYSVRVDTMRSGTADDLRNHLASLLPNIDGAILVGTLPVAWFRMEEYFSEDDTTIEIFPCDYYLSDLDGTWDDTDGDGILDAHINDGHTAPEIYVARIDPARLSYADPIALLKRYFDKDHAYRTGEMPIYAAALSYEYKDWFDFFEYSYSEFEYADIMRDSLSFCAPDYLRRIRTTPYEFVNIMCHSSPWRHYMDPTLTFNNDLAIIPSYANFYHLFACSGARFVEMDNLAATYLFMGPRALWVVGSSKTGSILSGIPLRQFIRNLRYINVGEDLRYILALYGEMAPEWHYGLVILGDPTLKLEYSSRGDAFPDTVSSVCEGEMLPTPGYAADVDVVQPGEDATPYIFVLNGGDSWFDNVEKFRFMGDGVSDLGTPYYHAAGTGELVIMQNSSTPYIASEGDRVEIGVLGNFDAHWDVRQGEGYHSHPAFISGEDVMALVYTYWQGAGDSVLCELHIDFLHDGDWTPAPGYDFVVSSSPYDKFFTSAALDSSGICHIFWTEATPDGYSVMWTTASAESGALSEPERVAYGTAPVCVVDADGVVHLFWRDMQGFLEHSSFADSRWGYPQVLFEDAPVFNLSPVLNQYGKPIVFFAARLSELNSDIYSVSLTDTGWARVRYTYNPAPDFAPDAAVLSDGRVFLAWISGATGFLAAYWNIFAPDGVDNEIPAPRRISVEVSPNPFNSAAEIFWSSGDEQFVRINDITGRPVAVLRGKGKVLWEPGSLPAGIYFVRVGNLPAKKIIYLK